jgi:4-phytase/acid phosphatase
MGMFANYSYTTSQVDQIPGRPGILTTHGRLLINILGSYYGQWLADEYLLNRQGCADGKKIYIWADTDQRTLETGRAFGQSILRGCEVQVRSRDVGKDPLFSGLGHEDPKSLSDAVPGRTGGSLAERIVEHRAAFDALQFILDGGKPAARTLLDSPGTHAEPAKFPGPFAVASTMSENLLLEYTNGMKGSALGWGRLTKDNLFQVLELHRIYADWMRRTPSLARARGSNLLAHILASLNQAASGKATPGALGQPDTSVVVLSRHDTNLSNLSGMLDLSWVLHGYQPDDTPPGGALVLSLWQNSNNAEFTLKAEYVAASLDQMRDAESLSNANRPSKSTVTLPGCQGSNCSWKQVRPFVAREIDTPAVDFKFR